MTLGLGQLFAPFDTITCGRCVAPEMRIVDVKSVGLQLCARSALILGIMEEDAIILFSTVRVLKYKRSGHIGGAF